MAAAVAASAHSASLLIAIANRERELRDTTERLLEQRGDLIETRLAGIRQFVTAQLGTSMPCFMGRTGRAGGTR